MYAYLNDFSMSMPADQNKPAWPLLYEVMEISSTLKSEYGIEYLKVPNNFKTFKIANSHSIIELLAFSDDDLDISNKQLIYDFLANRTMSDLDEVETATLKEIENKTAWVEVKYSNQYSAFFTGAYLLEMPIVSFQTITAFQTHRISCEYSIEYSDKIKVKNVGVLNIYSKQQMENHHPSLIRIKNDIMFGKGKWNPYSQPIWNNRTQTLIKEMEFPQSVEGKKDKISELKEIGEKIAVLNSWKLDSEMTSINSNAGQLRMVFISDSSHKHAYLSIDMKNANGRFEHHDYKGRHIGEIDFATGTYKRRGKSEQGEDNKGHHDLKLRR
ncbi:MAG: hypothetical protein V4649_05540 [Bacteroidota bacterium]